MITVAKNISYKQIFNIFSIIKSIFFIGIFIISCYLFYAEINPTKNPLPNDILVHLSFIKAFLLKQPVPPEMGYEDTVYYLAHFLHLSYFTIGVWILAGAVTLTAGIIYCILSFLLKTKSNQLLIPTAILLFVSAIYDPFFSKYWYFGQWSPNPWQNPTLIMMKPFAFLCTFLAIQALQTFDKRFWISLSLLLLVSVFYKPSFSLIFIPAFGLFILLNHTKIFKTYVYAFLLILPTIFYIIYQYWFFDPGYVKTILSPFTMLHIYTSNPFISLLLAIAFPLSILLLRYKQVVKNQYLQLSWLMLILGYLQMAILAQDSNMLAAGNYAWGYIIALDILFVFSGIEFIKWLIEMKATHSTLKRITIGIPTLLLFLHFASGVAYFIRILIYGESGIP